MSGAVAGIVLAAGSSRRLGRPKQAVLLDGETLVERTVRVASEAALAPVIVVVAPDAQFVARLERRGCLVAKNLEAAEGMGASIRCGVCVAAQLKATGAVVMACDQPGLRAAHLRSLVASPQRVTGSRYAGRVGVPAYFPAASFAALLALSGDAGARDLLQLAAFVEDESLALDVDTEADLEAARRASLT